LYSNVLQDTIRVVDYHTIAFDNVKVLNDPAGKYKFIFNDKKTITTWLFLVKDGGRIFNEAWKKEQHNKYICNVFNNDDTSLIHLQTSGFIKLEFIFKILYKVIDDGNDHIQIIITLDDTYYSTSIDKLYLSIEVFPYDIKKHLVYLRINGYIRTKPMIGLFPQKIKWYIDNIMQNIGDRLIVVSK
jgi:hypothetical protein